MVLVTLAGCARGASSITARLPLRGHFVGLAVIVVDIVFVHHFVVVEVQVVPRHLHLRHSHSGRTGWVRDSGGGGSLWKEIKS